MPMSSNRINSLDLMRGVVMALMAVDHVRVFSGVPAGGPTLDHSLWFHRPLDVQEWFLLDQEPVISAGARGLYQGGLYDQNRRRCTSLAQEILTRPAP